MTMMEHIDMNVNDKPLYRCILPYVSIKYIFLVPSYPVHVLLEKKHWSHAHLGDLTQLHDSHVPFYRFFHDVFLVRKLLSSHTE